MSSVLDNACYVNQKGHFFWMADRTITVRLPPRLAAWLDAVADVRKTTRSEVVRESIAWLAARESAQVARTRHYAVIALISRQERWNPVEDFLRDAEDLAAIRELGDEALDGALAGRRQAAEPAAEVGRPEGAGGPPAAPSDAASAPALATGEAEPSP
jgi:Arc/MetJ-type ribon-helix-helix transcriptional regulator